MSKVLDLQAEIKLTSSEEAFCRAYADDPDPGRAYVEAIGDKGTTLANEEAGKKMLASKRVKARIDQLTVLPPDPENMTRAAFHQRIVSTYEAAMADGDYAAANKAMELLGKSLGHLVDQRQTLSIKANLDGDDESKKQAIQKLARITGMSFDKTA